MRRRNSQIIAVCGGSGSGKSTLARKFVGAAILATDSFYKDIDDMKAGPDGNFDFDHPDAVDLEGCAEACLKLADGEDVMIPVYEMRSAKRVGTALVPAPKNAIVIVEGIFSFHSPLHDIATLRIFIDTPIDQRMARRLRRDVERGRNSLETIKYSLHVEDAYSRYVEPMKELADLILGEEERGGFSL